MTELELDNGSTLRIKNLGEDRDEFRFETLTGIRSNVPRHRVRGVRRLDRDKSATAIDVELEAHAASRGIRVSRETTSRGIEWKFEDAPGKALPGLTYFELADFCARNGRFTRVVPLFEAALRRDPNLVETVHEVKAARLVDAFLYFLSIRSKDDARGAYEILMARYRESRAVQDRILREDDDGRLVRAAYEELLGIATPPGAEPPIAGPPPKEPGEPSTPSKEPEKPPAEAKKPEPREPEKPLSYRIDLPSDAPSRAVDLVRRGDELFAKAMKHLLNSDQNVNPSGWEEENRRALKALTEAFEKYYYPAQEVYEKASKPIPQVLMARVREVQMTRALCRKRAVSSK